MSSKTMPAQSGDPISSALHLSFSTLKKCKGGDDIDARLCDKQALSDEIKYEETKCINATRYSDLKSKYVVLNTVISCSSRSEEVTSTKDSVISDVSSPKKLAPSSKEPTTLPNPKRVLYSPDAVRLGWSGSVPVGSGFVNLGNTCYLNSSLQALFHVPAFVNWLLSDTIHSSRCESLNGVTHSECLICAMSKTLQSSQKCTGSVVKPSLIYSKLKLICKHLMHGHQEDAHEFLRYLIEGMERSYLTIFNGIKLDNYSKETTPLSQIFGGYLRSEVTCLECQHVSTTFQHFQDLLLDIRTASSVDDALESFFLRERLGDGDQAYRCEQCKRRVAATKKFTIERPPKALCIALKRFGAMGGKNSKTINIKQILDISKFRHRPTSELCHYKLVSMVTHLGPSSSCGHYTAVGQTASGIYHLFDDNLVRPLPIQNVLNSNPYILMYELDTEGKIHHPTPKKEILTNGFSNTNGLSNSSLESKRSTPSSSINNSLNNIIPTASTSTEAKPGQITLRHNHESKIPFKSNCLGRPWINKQTQLPSVSNSEEQSSTSQQKCLGQLPQNAHQNNVSKQSSQEKESTSGTMDKPSLLTEKGTPTKNNFSQPSPTKPPTSTVKPSSSVGTLEKTLNSRENHISKIPLPNSTPEKNVEEKVQNNLEEHKSSPSLSLVPYGSDGSSESEGEFVPPKSSPVKEPNKLCNRTSGVSSPSVQNVKGFRIEVEGCDSTHLQGHNRPDLHSPAGSSSSGRWSVTSAERDKSPETVEKTFTSKIIIEKNDRISNGNGTNSSNGVGSERWDRNRGANSTMEYLNKKSHMGYGSEVKSWNNDKSEMDLQVEGERNNLKRHHDHRDYNDDFDRGKMKKMKPYHMKDNYGNGRNMFQDAQNRKNTWPGGNQRYFQRNYSHENRMKSRYNFPRRYWN